MTRPMTFASLLVAIPMLFAACGSEPAIPELTDPTEILEAAAAQAAVATSVRMDATGEGELGFGMAGADAAFELTDSTVSADINIAGGDARVTFALPGILGLRGELIIVDGTAFAKTSLTGPQYVSVPLGAGADDPSASPAAASLLAAITEALAQPGLEPVKGEDADCGGTSCYSVSIELTADELVALISGDDGAGGTGGGIDLPIPSGLPIPLPDLSGIVGADLTVLVEKGTGRLARLTAVLDAAETAQATIDARFSGWDEGVTVEAPPPDQVQGGS